MRQMTNLYKFELKRNIKSCFYWLLVIAVISIAFMSVYPSMGSSEMNDLIYGKLELIPDSLKAMFGLDKFIDFTQVAAFFGYCFQFILLALIIYAIVLGAKMLAREQDDKTIDFLVTKPLSKKWIVLTKFDCGILLITILMGCLLLVNIGTLAILNNFNFSFIPTILTMHLLGFILMIFFYSLSFLASALFNNSFHALGSAIGLFFVTYIIGTMSNLLESLKWLKNFSPYHIMDVIGQSNKISIPIIYTLCLLVIVGLALWGAVKIFKKKDLIV